MHSCRREEWLELVLERVGFLFAIQEFRDECSRVRWQAQGHVAGYSEGSRPSLIEFFLKVAEGRGVNVPLVV